jgi:hypothetical protein
MARLACVNIDLDELPHYCQIHGLSREVLPEGGDSAVYRVAPTRFLEACERAGIKSTLFLVGRDLEGDRAGVLKKAASAGHELGNHTYWHDYELAKQPFAEISSDIARGADVIASFTGVRPQGFRAPGYTFSASMYQALINQNYAYGSSVYPAAPYYLAKAVVMGVQKLIGRPSHAMLDHPAVLAAPRVPYLPDPEAPYRRGRGPVPELPVTVEPVTRYPFIGTYTVAMPAPLMMGLYSRIKKLDFINFELHGIDLMDVSDGAGEALAKIQRDLQVPARRKIDRLDELLARIAADYEVVTLLQASKRVP